MVLVDMVVVNWALMEAEGEAELLEEVAAAVVPGA